MAKNMTLKANKSERGSGRSPMAYLLPHPITSPSKPIAVSPLRTTIGRSTHNTIVIPSTAVSRRHAVIICREGDYYVKDMESRNGTFINEEKITVSQLHHHDLITFGDQHFLFLKRSSSNQEKKIDRLLKANSTITLSGDEIDLNSLYAYEVEKARLGLYPSEEKHAPSDDRRVLDEEDLGTSLLDRLSRRKSTRTHQNNLVSETAKARPSSQAHHRLSLLYRLSERLRITQNSQMILNEGLDLILEAIPVADRAAIMLRTGRGGKLELASNRNQDPQNRGPHIEISRTLLDWVLSEKMALRTQNVLDDARLKDSHSIRVNHFNAIICVPIIFERKVIGILYVDSGNPLAQLTEDDVAFTAAVAHELGLTIVNMQLQQKAIRNERMAAIGLTVSNLAHNIKNLMMLNQNAADLMNIHLDRINDQSIEKCWEIIKTGLSRINTLSMEMLEYAREQALSPTATDINRVIEDNTASIAHHFEGQGVNLLLDLASDLPHWTIDNQHFQRSLLNLIVNAVDAIGDQPDGEIRITTSVEKNMQLVVAVQDNGCGIDTDKQSKIFDLFFTTKGTKGSGLGLPMVKKFVQASGGELLVESQKSIGTTVKMVFPPG